MIKTLLTRMSFVLELVVLMGQIPAHAGNAEYGVYEFVVRKAGGTLEQVAAAVRDAATQAGWNVAAVVDAGKMPECNYHARVLLLFNSAYARQLMEINPKTAPFAILDRVNVFEDENGIEVSVVNPHSINRTILLDDTKHETMTEEHLQSLRSLITGVVHGEPSNKQYGEIRSAGYIGKTMGVVAGGLFNEKLEDEFTVAGGMQDEVAARIERALQSEGKEWGTHVVAKVAIPEFHTVVLGIAGTPLDTKSYEIVGAGDDDERSDFACPGLGHAGAYPFELVVVREGNDCRVRMVAPMFRMKIFFEDAGKWAFMKHMGMPGSVASEVMDRIKSVLDTH